MSNKHKILHNEKLGRYMVAQRNLKAGETILSERPILLGPQLDGPLICFSCCRNVRRAGFIICKSCDTAILCSSKCTGFFHPNEECEVLKLIHVNGHSLEDNDQIIFPLRCLLLKKYKPVVWQTLLELESHLEARRDTMIWRRHQITAENVLRNLALLSPEELDSELLQKICGILDVNTFEVRPPLTSPSNKINPEVECLRGLYLTAALMAHDCVGNTLLSVDDEFVLTVKASVDISENEPVLFNYSNVLQGSADRKQHLREGKYFECSCNRCTDPSELGTDINSLMCHKCRKGIIRVKDTSQSNSNWVCSDCKGEFSPYLIRTTIEEGRRRIYETGETSIEGIEKLYQKFGRTFTTNHFLLLELKQTMIGLYTRQPPTRKNLLRKAGLCQEVLGVVSIIEPGISRLKAITLYYLQSALIDLAHKEHRDRCIKTEQLVAKLLEAESLLKEAIKYLLHEPRKSPEGKLVQTALSELKMLRSSVENVKRSCLEQSDVNCNCRGSDKTKNSKVKGKMHLIKSPANGSTEIGNKITASNEGRCN